MTASIRDLQSKNHLLVRLYSCNKLSLGNPFTRRVRIEYRSRPEQQRLAPVCQSRDVGRECNDRCLESIDLLCEYRVARETELDVNSRTDDAFDEPLQRFVVRDHSKHQLCFSFRWNDVSRDSSFDHSDVHRGCAKRFVGRPLGPLKIGKHFQQLINCRLALLWVSRMSRSPA